MSVLEKNQALFHQLFNLLQLDDKDPLAVVLFNYIIDMYSRPKRRYHDFRHIRKSLAILDKFADEAENLPALTLAIWFHDIEQGPNHEQSSAETMKVFLRPFIKPSNQVLTELFVKQTAKLIWNTIHPSIPHFIDGQLIHDIDLHGFSLPFDHCLRNSQIILSEALGKPEDARAGQKAWLKNLLAFGQIYHHPRFSVFEVQARNNIKRLINNL